METAKVQQLMDDAKNAQGDANAFNALSATADKIVKEAPDSAQAIQTQLLMAKLAYDKADYAQAERALKKVENSKLDDAGLVQLVKLRLAYAQLAQKKYDDALKTLSAVTDPAFKATADEALGDVYVAKNDIENAKKSYKSAWDALVERQQERQILQIKLESVGVLVDDPDVERPILETQVDES
jgi:predicted negative regulator of RcsB-dependent stress response